MPLEVRNAQSSISNGKKETLQNEFPQQAVHLLIMFLEGP
jgi:hypothetical protein